MAPYHEPHRSQARSALGLYLRRQREAAGLTQADLSKLLNYSSPQFISNWERGAAPPPHEAIAQLIPVLKLDRRKVLDLYLGHTESLIRKAFSKVAKSKA